MLTKRNIAEEILFVAEVATAIPLLVVAEVSIHIPKLRPLVGPIAIAAIGIVHYGFELAVDQLDRRDHSR